MALVSAAGLVAAGLIATGISGCADMSGIAPQSSLRDAPSLGLNAVPAQVQTQVAAEWWRDFGDETLNGLVAKALETSPNLKLAQARLARAQAAGEVANAATLPQLNGQLDLTRQRYTANGAVPPPLAGSISESGTAQLAASWELDFFGKNRAALDAALGSVNAAQADAQAARVLLASQVARTYFQLVRLNEQAGVASRTLAQREETLKLVRDRVNAGLDTRLELRQSEGGLPEARLQLEAVQEQLALARNALNALVGEPNSALALVPSAQARLRPKTWSMPRPSSTRTSTWSPLPVFPASGWAVCWTLAASSGASARRCVCRFLMRAGCAPTCAAGRLTWTQRLKATTPQ